MLPRSHRVARIQRRIKSRPQHSSSPLAFLVLAQPWTQAKNFCRWKSALYRRCLVVSCVQTVFHYCPTPLHPSVPCKKECTRLAEELFHKLCGERELLCKKSRELLIFNISHATKLKGRASCLIPRLAYSFTATPVLFDFAKLVNLQTVNFATPNFAALNWWRFFIIVCPSPTNYAPKWNLVPLPCD